MNEKEKAITGAVTINEFVKKFGEPDTHTANLLDILLEELYYASPIYLFSEPEQEGDQTDLNDQIPTT